MKLLTLLATILLTGCQSLPSDTKMFFNAKSNFTYVSDKADEWKAYTSIDNKFDGDCEDFAFTLQRQIGGKVAHVVLEDNQGHAVLVKNNMVYDNIKKWPVKLTDYKGNFKAIMNFNDRGLLIDNRRY